MARPASGSGPGYANSRNSQAFLNTWEFHVTTLISPNNQNSHNFRYTVYKMGMCSLGNKVLDNRKGFSVLTKEKNINHHTAAR